MPNDLNKRLADFSKTKTVAKHITYTIAVNLENKEKFNLIKRQYNLTSNELMMILLEGVTNAKWFNNSWCTAINKTRVW